MDSGWSVIIIVLVIAMAVGPVMLMQPSGRQRRLASLRQQAAGVGMTVGVIAWPTKAGDKPTGAMRYGLPWLPESRHSDKLLLVKKDYEHDLHTAGFWHKVAEQGVVKKATDQLLNQDQVPAGVYALGFDGMGAFVDWSEERSADLPVILAFLQQLRASAQ